jgi:hypothetical protein
MEILVVAAAIGNVVSGINAAIGIGNSLLAWIAGYGPDPARAALTTLQAYSLQIINATNHILGAIAALDATLFRVTIASNYGDLDQAVLALDHWVAAGDPAQRAEALSRSAAPLLDLCELRNTGAYSEIALLLPLQRALATRIFVLRRLDDAMLAVPGEHAALLSALDIVDSAVDEVNDGLMRANEPEIHRYDKYYEPTDTWNPWYDVRYLNLAQTHRFREEGWNDREDGVDMVPAALEKLQPIRREGLRVDRTNAAIEPLQEANRLLRAAI